MKSIAVIFAVLGAASAGLLTSAPLLPKVNIAPTQVNVVRQPIHVTQAEPVLRSVPVPVRAVAYTAPAIAAPAITTYAAAAPLVTGAIAAPAFTTYSAAPALAHGGLIAPGLSYAAAHTLAAPAIHAW